MPPKKQSKKSSAKPKGRSKSKAKARPKSAPQSLPFSALPIDITFPIFSYIDDRHTRQDFYNYIQVSRQFYTRFVPSLYQRLELEHRNVNRIFRGINLDTGAVKQSTRHKSNSDSAFDSEVSEGSEEENNGRPEDEEGGSTSKLIGKEGEWNSGLSPQDEHDRKVSHLQHVKSLIITDWTAASTVAAVLKDSEGNLNHDPPFSQLDSLALGHSFLRSNEFYPDCACDTEPVPTRVTKQLATLRPKHVCADWSASVKYHLEEDGFDTYVKHVIGQYNLESFTWHNISSGTLFPWCPAGVLTFRAFAKDCGGWNAEEQEYDECECRWTLRQASQYCLEKKKSNIHMEIINLDCLGEIVPAYIDHSGKVPRIEHAQKGEVVVDPSRSYIKVTMKAQAEPCVCCGMK
ncbi:hypothetical protein I204_08314 [Kwoniella mangroviensis CBS 8886]|uniref:hypothetical protein n=1 Tax=Kwoniella mangroviensis CBS 8507 TaxID=1296122 RepID=UPI00080D6EE4|nr:uncharacterized protein I203_08140 [Kwoniella mangroviensis CBS 8507]OCF62825.1 hypothetical protein I203_08140 [Kwoniella mangroviensis CBS 8507]OCF71078.1 hypothetical protein I204_08314 [Kwoniella mangroviensis CBS 8886]